MKSCYIHDIFEMQADAPITLLAWIKAKRSHGDVVFVDLADSTGSIQAVFEQANVAPSDFDLSKHVTTESAVKVEGVLIKRIGSRMRSEISARSLQFMGSADFQISPQPRSDVDIFDPTLKEQLLKLRHFYLRNERVMAILRFRHLLMGFVHQWFRENGFIELTAPLLTPLPLHDDHSAVSLEINQEKIFLTQCAGFYLESAVHAFEKVYNVGPSFRAEESRSRRHLIEYWHIKAELAFADFEDIISTVEHLIVHVTRRCREEAYEIPALVGTVLCSDGLKAPYPRISYMEALEILLRHRRRVEFGKSLSSEDEKILSNYFQSPFWITGIPRTIEPFPYVIDSNEPRVTKTGDLIATRGFGELLGVAEKSHDLAMLDERMREKGKLGDQRYDWIRDLRRFGCVPHAGFGLGVKRFIGWLLQIPHVRDAIPFPRTFRRRVYP
jgi:asparaginyl-tRNA synthetase